MTDTMMMKVKEKNKPFHCLGCLLILLTPLTIFCLILMIFLTLTPVPPHLTHHTKTTTNAVTHVQEIPAQVKPCSPSIKGHDDLPTIENYLNMRKSCQCNSSLKNIHTAKSLNDKILLDFLRCFHLTPPLEHESPKKKALIPPPIHHEKCTRTRKLRKLLENQENGFFVDCSPCMKSHSPPFSLNLEILSNWEGLLFERDPIKMLQLNVLFPKSWISNACLSISKKRPFLKIKDKSKCFSILSFLQVLNKTRIDLLSVGKGELAPWNIIKPLLSRPEYHIEVIDLAHGAIESVKKTLLRNYIKSKGYNLTLATPKHYIFERDPPTKIRERRVAMTREKFN